MTGNELFNLGREVKSAYKRYNSLHHPEYFFPPKYEDPKYWRRSAEECNIHKLDPDEFIGIVMECARIRRIPFVYPNMLSGKSRLVSAAMFNVAAEDAGTVETTNPCPASSGRIGGQENTLTISRKLYASKIESYVDNQLAFLNSILAHNSENISKTYLNNLGAGSGTTDAYGRKLYGMLAVLKMDAFAIPAWLRVLLAPFDKTVISRYGKSALIQLGVLKSGNDGDEKSAGGIGCSLSDGYIPGLMDELDNRFKSKSYLRGIVVPSVLVVLRRTKKE